MSYSNAEILANRHAWADFLLLPETKKHQGKLDNGDDHRCCLGHGCFALGIPSKLLTTEKENCVVYAGQWGIAPQEFIDMVGLHNCTGHTKRSPDGKHEYMQIGEYTQIALSAFNDNTNATPQQIGAYLKTVINGGDNTPFVELTDD